MIWASAGSWIGGSFIWALRKARVEKLARPKVLSYCVENCLWTIGDVDVRHNEMSTQQRLKCSLIRPCHLYQAYLGVGSSPSITWAILPRQGSLFACEGANLSILLCRCQPASVQSTKARIFRWPNFSSRVVKALQMEESELTSSSIGTIARLGTEDTTASPSGKER